MSVMSTKSQELLSQFNGRWGLDLKRSDPITPMLEALKTPYLVRKMAASMQVEQTIKVDGSDLEICNHTVVGTSAVVHAINGGAIELTDDKGDKTLDDTIVDERAEYPVVIQAVLPKGKGFTKDSRRVVNDDEMQQVLEYRCQKEDVPIVMKRFWNRVSGSQISIPKQASKIEVSLKRTPVAEAPQTSLTSPPAVHVDVRVTQQLTRQAEPIISGLATEDWPMMALLTVFFTSAWYRACYLEGCFWGAIMALFRTNVVFPASTHSKSVDWWGLPNATFACTAVAMIYATRVILNPIENDPMIMALESFTAVGAYCWTRRGDLAALNLVKVFQGDGTTSISKAWAELSLLGVAIVATCTDEVEGLPMSKVMLAAMLYGVARHRIQILSAGNSRIKVNHAAVVNVEAAQPVRSTFVIKKKEKTGVPKQSHPMVRFLASRVAKYSSKPFAQYLGEVDLGNGKGTFSVWCRYRDLNVCRDAITRAYAANGWGETPRFPPKQWDSVSDEVVARRQIDLDSFFSRVFADHGDAIAKIDQVATVLHLDESRAKILQEVHEATRRLFQARQVCELAVAEGENARNGWMLTDAGKREYCKVFAGGERMFKRIAVTMESPDDAMKRLTSNRHGWDPKFLSQSIVRKISLTSDDEQRALSGMKLQMDQNFVPIKHIRRSRASIFNMRPRDAVVFQAIAKDPLTGRMIFVETSVGTVIEEDVFPEAEGYVREHVIVNGFIVEPFAGGRTKVTSIRNEDTCTEGFAVI